MALNFTRLEDISRSLKSSNQTGKSFHTTFIYNGSKMLTIGMNDYGKIHRSHKWGDYKSTRANSKYTAALHSELSAIIKLGLSDCSHLTIVNIRIDNNNNPAISKPCMNCRKILEQVGYKNLYYFDGKKYIKN